MTRNLFFSAILAMAIGVPYLLHEGGMPDFDLGQLGKSWKSSSKDTPSQLGDDSSIAHLLGSDPTVETGEAEAAPGVPISGPEVSDLRTVFRFSTTPEWVIAHWSRVSTLEVDSMKAFRVPLVTGVRLDDVAGSLTYCFDEQNQLQRISFRGATGDPRRLEQLVAGAFGLQLETSRESGLYMARWNGQPTSFLKIENADLIRADSPHTRYVVRMEINRPRAHLKVSDELQAVAARNKPASRWRW